MSAPVVCKKPTPSQINLIKNAKNHFLLFKQFKNTESAQLCSGRHYTATLYLPGLWEPWAGRPRCQAGRGWWSVRAPSCSGRWWSPGPRTCTAAAQSSALEVFIVFFNFFNNKKWLFCIFYQVNNLFLHLFYLKPTPSQINLINIAKNNFLLLKKFKNTEIVQLCTAPNYFACPLRNYFSLYL